MRTARGNSEQISQELGPDDAIKTSSSQGAEAAKQSTHAALAGRYPRVNPPTIQVVGVWDTVGALGVPGFGILSPDLSRYFSFFDPGEDTRLGKNEICLTSYLIRSSCA